MIWMSLFWCFLAVCSGIFASQHRGRSGFGWFLVAVIFSPLVAFILLLVLRVKEQYYAIREHAGVARRYVRDGEGLKTFATRAEAAMEVARLKTANFGTGHSYHVVPTWQ